MLDYVILGIRRFDDARKTVHIRVSLAVLTALLDRLGRNEPAAVIAGFAVDPFSTAAVREINTTIAHLRDVLGDPFAGWTAGDGASSPETLRCQGNARLSRRCQSGL